MKKNIVVILGRSQDFRFELKQEKSLVCSYLNFFKDFIPIPEKKSNLKEDFGLDTFFLAYLNNNTSIFEQHYKILNDKLEPAKIPIFEIHKTNKQVVYFVEIFESAKGYKLEVLACILKTLIEQNCYSPNKDNLFYFCHGEEFGKKGREELIDGAEKNRVLKSINEFLYTEISNDNIHIVTFFHEDTSRIFLFFKEKKYEVLSFNSPKVIDLYNSFDKEKLEEIKKKLINTFLPLILDIKGFGEVTDSKQRKEYRKEILLAIGKEKSQVNTDNGRSALTAENDEEFNGYGNDLITGWNEIKEVLALKTLKNPDPKPVLSAKYQINEEYKPKLYFSPLESENKPGFSVEDITDLFADSKEADSKEKEKEKARKNVIKWLNGIIKVIDDKIEQKKEAQPSSK